jgi:RND family efflux transporter MFP subunit
MKKISLFLVLATIMLAACTSKKTDKEQLNDLLKQKSEIEQKIKDLQAKMPQTVDSTKSDKLITVEDLKPSDFSHFIEVQGQVDADENVWVTSIGGIVTKINVKEGDYVSVGQVLAETDASALMKGIDEAKNGLSLATTVYDKQKRLWDQNIGSEIQFLQAKNNKEAAEKAIQRLQAQLEMTKMKSPVSGTVDEVKVRLGEMASPGTPYSGIRIVNTSMLSVKAKLADSELGKINKGDKVSIVFPDLNKKIESTVSFVGQVVNAQSRTFMVQSRLNNGDHSLAPNMIAKMMINDKLVKDVLVVPSNVVQNSMDGFYVLVAEKKGNGYVVSKKAVTPGLDYGGRTIIEKGLMVGDKIITTGYTEMVEGQDIRF